MAVALTAPVGCSNNDATDKAGEMPAGWGFHVFEDKLPSLLLGTTDGAFVSGWDYSGCDPLESSVREAAECGSAVEVRYEAADGTVLVSGLVLSVSDDFLNEAIQNRRGPGDTLLAEDEYVFQDGAHLPDEVGWTTQLLPYKGSVVIAGCSIAEADMAADCSWEAVNAFLEVLSSRSDG